MDWFKKTAGKIHTKGHSRSSSLASPGSPSPTHASKSPTAQSSANQESGTCCAIGGRKDGTFGDDDNGWRVRRAWKAAVNGGEAEMSEYLKTFADVFGKGPPSMDGDEHSVFPFELTHKPKSIGHPHVAVTSILTLLSSLSQELTASTTTFPLDATPQFFHSLSRIRALLQHIEILTRYDGNRDAIRRHSGVESIVQVISLGSTMISRGPLDSNIQDDTSQIVFYSLGVLQRSLDSSLSWNAFVRSNIPPSPTLTDAPPWTTALHLTLLRALAVIYKQPGKSRTNQTLRIQALNTLGALLSQWTPTLGNALNLCGVLDVVASIIGNPATERTDEEEFACQVLAWDVIRLGQHHSLSKPSSIADNVAGLWKWSYDCTFPNSSLLSALHSPERRVLDVSPVDWSECSIEPDVLSQAIFTAAAGISKILPHRVISHVLGSRRPKEATLSKGIEDFILYLARILRMSGRVRDGVIIALTHLLAKAGEDIEKRRSYVFNSLGTHNLWPMLIADLSPVAVSFCTYAGVLGCADVVPQLLSSVESHQDAQLVCEIIGPLVQFRPDLGKLLADSGGMEKLMSLLQSVETSEVDMERFVALFEILLQNPDIKAWSLPRSEIFVSLLERGVGKDAEFGASFLVECISALAAQSQQEEDSNGDSKAGNNHTRIITLGGILHQTFASMENVDPRTAPVIFRGLQVVLEDERKRERVVDSGGPGCFVGILGSKLAQKSDDVVVGALRCLGACGKVGTWVWDDVLSQIGQPSSAVLQALEAVLLSSSTTAPNMNEETLRSILKAYNQWSRTCKAWLRRFLIQHVQACRLNMYRAGVLEWSIGCINDMRFTDDTVETGDVEEISELCEIVKWVGSWGVRVRDVKGLLRATRPRNTKETSSEADPELGDLRPFLSSLPESWVLPSWWDLLFNTIVDIAVDGERGDLELFYKETVGITVDKWPGGSGWGILCWFWSEEGSLDGLPVTRFVMRKEDSEHEIALSSEEVVTGEQPMHRLRLKAPGVDVTSETSLTTGWHLVVLSYIPSKLPWTSQGELKFWLDGNPLTRTRCDGLESGRWSNIVGKDVSVVHMVDDVVRGREVRAAFKNGVKGLVEGRSTVAGRFGGIARKTFTSALHAVGGVGVLLGILSVLDLPTAGATVSEDDGRLCLRVKRWFQLLKACLGDAVHRGSLLGIRGAIAMLLRRWHGRGLNTETFLKVLDIARIECMADFDELAFDFHIWGVTKTEMCLEWLRSVHQNVRTEAEVVVHTTNVKKNYNRKWNATYWIGVLADNCFPTTDTKDMQLLRKFVLGVAKEILSQRWDEADMRSIIELLWRWTGTNLLLEEVISVLLEVFVHCPDARALEGFFAVGGAELVFWMLSHNDAGEAVRVLCLQLIFLGLNNPRIHEKWKKRLRLEDVGWLCGDNKEGSIALLMPMLQKVALSRRVYLGVLQLALDEVILDWETREALCSVVELRNGKVQSVDYLQVIWRLCASRNVEAKVKIDILRDLIVIVCRKGNGDVVRSTEWIEGVVGMLTPRRKGLKDRGAEAESTKELSDTEPVWPLMDEEVVLASPMPNANAEGHTGLTVDQTPQPAIGSSGEDERVTALVYEALTALTLETFDKNRKAWHSAEEVCAWIWITDGDFTSVKTYLIRVLKKLNEGIGVGGWKCVGHNRLENIVHLLLLSEEVMFGWRDLREGVLKEVRGDQEKSRLAFLPDILTAGTPTMRSPTTVRMSFPIGECPDLVEECLDILSGMIDFGINSVDLSDKSHARPGGLVRLAVRILLSALAVPDEAAWHLAFRHLIPLMDKHAAIFTERKEQAYYILGHLYDGFAAACRTKGDDNGASHVDYHILLPLYTLLVSRWKHLILGLSSVDDASKPLLDEQLIDKAIADPEVFVHLVQSPIWESLYNTYFFPAMRSVEESEFAMVPTVVRRFARAGKAMRMRVLKERAFVELLGGAMTSSLEKIAMGKREDESAKVPEREREIESDRRVVWKTWAECWKSITRERGIWGTAGTMKWKLDRTENAWRMRNRFVENWEFDDHSDASAKRDKTMKPEEDLGGALTRSASVRERLATSVGDGVLRQLSALSLNYNDSEEGDEWNMVGEEDAFSPTPAGPLLDVSDKGMAYSGECELILLNTAVKGRVEVSKTRITFKPDVKATTAGVSEAEREAIFVLLADADVLFKDRSWWVDDIRDCLLRRYMLRKASLELFFTDRTNWMFHFPGTGKVALKERAKFLKALRALKPKIFAGADPRRTPADIAKRSGVTELWCKGALSNFEYLMWLNTVSGRTYNDLTQYPVFPWILRDYESPSVDLNDPNVFRDLSKPIGAQDEVRLQQYIERYNAFEDPSGQIKKFHYGTHYSSAAAVVFYLLRVEPFASLHIALQGGKFDHPDRQFHSLQSCWKSVCMGSGDVKELIPEFFYMPELLVNENGFNLGVKQTDEALNDVILPPWAPNPEAFIRMHREALECDYVSERLHEWIDLIWGYKQTGPEAEKACNVFYYLTYEDAIDVDGVRDPMERRAIEDQILNFGQTPSKLFNAPHPKKEVIGRVPEHMPEERQLFLVTLQGHGTVFVASGQDGRIILVDEDGFWRMHAISSLTLSDFKFESDWKVAKRRHVSLELATHVGLRPGLFALSPDAKFFVTAGHWDKSLKVVSIPAAHHHTGLPTPGAVADDRATTVQVGYGHLDIVTCCDIVSDGIIITGARDSCVRRWQRSDTGGQMLEKGWVSGGHEDWITCIAASQAENVVASGSKDGTVILHNLFDGRYLQSLCPSVGGDGVGSSGGVDGSKSSVDIRHVKIIEGAGMVACYGVGKLKRIDLGGCELGCCAEDPGLVTGYLFAWTLNGRPLFCREIVGRAWVDMCVIENGKRIVGVEGGRAGGIVTVSMDPARKEVRRVEVDSGEEGLRSVCEWTGSKGWVVVGRGKDASLLVAWCGD